MYLTFVLSRDVNYNQTIQQQQTITGSVLCNQTNTDLQSTFPPYKQQIQNLRTPAKKLTEQTPVDALLLGQTPPRPSLHHRTTFKLSSLTSSTLYTHWDSLEIVVQLQMTVVVELVVMVIQQLYSSQCKH
jgi:hypothetical protein